MPIFVTILAAKNKNYNSKFWYLTNSDLEMLNVAF
jgi:hypothetical protein